MVASRLRRPLASVLLLACQSSAAVVVLLLALTTVPGAAARDDCGCPASSGQQTCPMHRGDARTGACAMTCANTNAAALVALLGPVALPPDDAPRRHAVVATTLAAAAAGAPIQLPQIPDLPPPRA